MEMSMIFEKNTLFYNGKRFKTKKVMMIFLENLISVITKISVLLAPQYWKMDFFYNIL